MKDQGDIALTAGGEGAPDRLSPDRLIEVRGLGLRLGGREVLRDVDLLVERGRIVTLIGPNGSGKTSLVRVALGLLEASSGYVWRRPDLRIGYMPQRLHIDPVMPLDVRRFLGLGCGLPAQSLLAALREVGAEDVFTAPIQEISGGETQRVLLARALLRDPDILVLDEPVQGVDVTGQAEFYGMIGELRRRRGCAVLMVSHDLHLVMAATDHVICLNQHVCCAGTPASVSADPRFGAVFGAQVAASLAVYAHTHDHTHGHNHNHG